MVRSECNDPVAREAQVTGIGGGGGGGGRGWRWGGR